MSYLLSKTRFLAGLQCAKLLWWKVKEPGAPELKPEPALQFVFDQGTEVGLEACRRFAGGVTIDLPYWEDEGRVEATRKAMASGAPAVFEATFVEEGVFVAVDILARGEGGAWRIIEVKSATKVKEVNVPDAAVQAWVLGRAAVPLEAVEVMVLNRECVHPHLENLFRREDVTEGVMDLLPSVPRAVQGQKEMLEGPLPEVAVGDHCTDPYDCPFLERCWPDPVPFGVDTLYRGGKKKAALAQMGIETLREIPDDFALSDVQERQRKAARSGVVVVEGDLKAALAPLAARPLAFLDFETVAPAIPRWPGCRPYSAVPVQFSCHVLGEGEGNPRHIEWLASGSEDPRPECARRLVELLGDVPAVVAYNSSFEMARIRELAEAVPQLAAPLLAINECMVDLLPVVRDHVYHPDFGGSFRLKAVLPALVPDLSYEGLVIKAGEEASVELFRLLFAGEALDEAERAALRKDLLAYCGLDTLALVRLKGVLEGLT